MTRVLVVDDNTNNVYLLTALLQGHGYQVVTAANGAEALEIATSHPPDLIVSDLLMPVMDGFTLLRHCKVDVRLQAVPFVVYTATYTEPEDERLAFQLGATSFITKPAEPDDLLVQVEAALSAPIRSPDPDGAQKSELAMLHLYSSTLVRKLERKMLQLEHSNRELQQQATLLDLARDAIAVRDAHHRITYWNDSAARLYGWTAAEAQGRLAADLLRIDAERFAEADGALARNGEWRGELLKTTRDGTVRSVECSWTLVRGTDGERQSILTIDTDVTDRRLLEQQFLRAQRLESIGTLAGGIAHDLNNVLTPIMMSVSILRLDETDSRRIELLDTLESSAQRGADMIRQVLGFARGIDGERVDVLIGELVRDMGKIASEIFLKSISVQVDLPDGLWLVQGDPTQLHQVLLNLCVNARDAMPQGGTLRLSAENLMIDEHHADSNAEARPGAYVVMTVEDSGSGIPAAVVNRIFEPFFTTKEPGKGTGLGLSTTRAIIKSHGGFTQVYTEPGHGTTFKVFVPALRDRTAAADPVSVPELPRGNGELVLVVDDEEAVREVTARTLSAFGYRVVTASDGAEAVSRFAPLKNEVAAVVTDMMMPVMDGATAIQLLRRLSPTLPIVAVSGLLTETRADAATTGIRHFLAKPFTAEALLKELHAALSERALG